MLIVQVREEITCRTLPASPRGLTGAAFGRFTAAYPVSTAAALTAHWAWYTRSLLDLEAACPEACLRLRSEDLLTHAETAASLRAFLDLAPSPVTSPVEPRPPAPADEPPRPPFPVDQLPPDLLAQVNELAARLGYPRA